MINYGSGSSNQKSRISDPEMKSGNHPITDLDPTFELQIDKKTSKFGKICHFLDINGYILYVVTY